MKRRIQLIALAAVVMALGSLVGLGVGSAADRGANQASDEPICTDQASCDALGGNNSPPPVPEDEAGPGDGEEEEAPPVEESADPPEAASSAPQPEPQPQPVTPPTPSPAAPVAQPPEPQPVAQPPKPVPAAPKPVTPVKPVPATPPGPVGGDVMIRVFQCDWYGGPLRCDLYVSHSHVCHARYPGGSKDIPVRQDRNGSDNGEQFQVPLENFSLQGGDAVIVCDGWSPGKTPGTEVYHVKPAPVSTQTAKVQRTKVVKKKITKHGKRTTKVVKVKVTVQVTLPIPPDDVPGWCYTNPKGVWGFIQAPVAGSTRSLYTPGVGPHCDPPLVSKAEWRLYLNTFYHGKDPRKK